MTDHRQLRGMSLALGRDIVVIIDTDLTMHNNGRMFTRQHWNEGLGIWYDKLKKFPDRMPQRKMPRGPPVARTANFLQDRGTSRAGSSGRVHLGACALALVKFKLNNCPSAGLSEVLIASDTRSLLAVTSHRGAQVT